MGDGTDTRLLARPVSCTVTCVTHMTWQGGDGEREYPTHPAVHSLMARSREAVSHVPLTPVTPFEAGRVP